MPAASPALDRSLLPPGGGRDQRAIPPVIPCFSAARPARGRPGAARPLPLPVPPVHPPAPGRDVVYGLARIDASGRVADRTVTARWAGTAATG